MFQFNLKLGPVDSVMLLGYFLTFILLGLSTVLNADESEELQNRIRRPHDPYYRRSVHLESESEPHFIKHIPNLTVSVGREAIFTCTVNSLTKNKVAWIRAEDQTILTVNTKVVTHNPRISIYHDSPQSWQLRIRQLKSTDAGCYVCQINTNILKSQQGCLDVLVSPDVSNENTSGDVTVNEGDNATLWCRATGHPYPRITWRKEDGSKILMRRRHRDLLRVSTHNGSSLDLWRVDRKQIGPYLCIANNDVPPAVSKRIMLNVNFAPVIKVPNQLFGAPMGTNIHFECFAEAFPTPINYWVKNNGEMLLNGSKYFIKEEKNGFKIYMSLLIHSFNSNDVGTYNCVSTNSLGKAEGTLRLYGISMNLEDSNQNYLSADQNLIISGENIRFRLAISGKREIERSANSLHFRIEKMTISITYHILLIIVFTEIFMSR